MTFEFLFPPNTPTIEEIVGGIHFIGAMLITQDAPISIAILIISFFSAWFINSKFKLIREKDEKEKKEKLS